MHRTVSRFSRQGMALLVAHLLLAATAHAGPSSPVIQQKVAPVQAEIPAASPFDPQAPPQPEKGRIVPFTLEAKRARLELQPGQVQEVWTFNGSVPGPTLRVHQGDTVRFTLINRDPEMEHGLDFHAGQMDMGTFHKPIKPGESITFDWKAEYPGVFYYHCSAGPVIMHIANGMFGAVIVDPPGYKPAGKEYVLIQHEWYSNPTDLNGLLNSEPAALAFNGVPNQYLSQPLTADPGEPVRFYFVDAGPNRFSAFHVIGTIFDKVLLDGNPENVLHGVQTITVPPGGAVIADLVADTGTYAILTHVLRDATKGALGLLKVGQPAGAQDAGGHAGATEPAAASAHQAASAASGTAQAASSAGQQPVPSAVGGENVVTINTFTFSPPVLRVKAGTTVTWVNQDSTEHAVVHADAAAPASRLFDSTGENEGKPRQLLAKGDSFHFTFDKPGTYHYKCLPHPFMTGTIVVE